MGMADDQVLHDLPGLVLERSSWFQRMVPCPDLGPVLKGFFRLACIEARKGSSASMEELPEIVDNTPMS